MSSMFGATGKPQNIKGTGYKSVVSNNFTPEQSELFKQMFSSVGPDSFTSKLAGGDQSSFHQLEAPALQQFNGLQGNLASRFSGMGGTGGRKSSGFQNTANSAASDFAQQLQASRLGIQQQAIQQLHGMSSDLLGQRPYEQNFFQQQAKEPSFWEKLLAGLGGAGTQVMGTAGTLYGAGKLGIG